MPKKPKPVKVRKEPASVTIGNLELQNRNLETRVADLVEARDRYLKLANERERRISELSHELSKAQTELMFVRGTRQETQAKLASTESEFKGYRQAIADMFRE